MKKSTSDDASFVRNHVSGKVPEILYEDNHLLAINKPSGMLSQSDYTGDKSAQDILKDYIKDKYNKPGNVFLGIVHRLDKCASGVLVFARTSKAASRLSEGFRNHHIKKLYTAVTSPNEKFADRLNEFVKFDGRISRHHDISSVNDDGEKDISMDYKTIIQNNKYAVHIIDLGTGRKHQIRTVFSSLGAPIIGDTKYGSPIKLKNKDAIMLHCMMMEFEHPTAKTPVIITSKFPDHFCNYLSDDVIKSIVSACRNIQ